ncbi:MAG TPA: carboxypeptidase regulatory-like domain-containing protein [Beijerinckiaceae bacterium]|nr:carboxypeptidase regulatory-like domain-containing protein [Beijerinckiaceae bacterium]
MRATLFPVIVGLTVLAGCQQTVKVESSFDPKAAEYIHKAGEGRIDGHAFLKKPNGYVMHASGDVIYLIPATPYAKERMQRLYGASKFMPATRINQAETTDPRYLDFTRRTKAESNGRFTFDKVAPGEYFIVTTLTWKDNENDILSRGGSIYETVTVTGKEDKIIRVVVNGI